MAMTPGNQAIVGGTALRIPAIQSPNYSPGSLGWIINIDGTAEFNSGTFRGSIEVGPTSGAHFIVNNTVTGDVIDVYNSSNQLVFSINAAGDVISYSPGSFGDPYVRFHNGQQEFNNGSGFTTTDPPSVSAPDITVVSTELSLRSGTPDGSNNDSVIRLFGGTTASSAEIRATSRGGITGDVLHLDTANNDRNLVHIATYNVTTDGGGSAAFNHGCFFTPVAGFLAGVNGIGANFPYQYAWFPTPFNSNTAHAAFKDNLGAALANTTLGVFGVFYG